MLRRYTSLIKSVTSSISNVRHCIASMSSQGLVLTGTSDEELECCKKTQNGAGLCSCNEVTIKRTISSHTKASEESQDHKAREELQWNKLSENEKNIYFAHKTACLVSSGKPLLISRHWLFYVAWKSVPLLNTCLKWHILRIGNLRVITMSLL